MESKPTILRRIHHEPSDGRPAIRYRIQLIDDQLIDEAVLLLHDHFTPRENLSSSLGISSDEDAVEQLDGWSKKAMAEEGCSLAALLEDASGNPGPIIGVNVVTIKKAKTEKTKPSEKRSEKVSTMAKVLWALYAKENIFDRYKCSSYLSGCGLVVMPEYERRGIASEMLKAQAEVCRMKDTPVGVDIFTSKASQNLAKKCGYESLGELDLSEFRIDGELVLKQPEYRTIIYMAKKYY